MLENGSSWAGRCVSCWCCRWLILIQDKHVLLHIGDDTLSLSELVDMYVYRRCFGGIVAMWYDIPPDDLPGSSCTHGHSGFSRLERVLLSNFESKIHCSESAHALCVIDQFHLP